MSQQFLVDEISARAAELRQAQAEASGGLLEKFKSRIETVENLRIFGVAITVIGALSAAIARSVEGNIGLGLTISGAAISAIAGLFIALMDRRKLDISTEAATAVETSESAINVAEEATSALESLIEITQDFDTKRRERLAALGRMISAIEASLILNEIDAKKAATVLLSRAIQSIRASVDYEGGDFFTITIFRKQIIQGSEKMVRIAAEWTDPDTAEKGGRSWPIGKGYTGKAWQNATTNPNGDVIIADTSKSEIQVQYPVDDHDPEREKLYRSVAAIPILINEGNDVWGVVTATSDRKNVFQRDPENIRVQNVDVIRDIAKISALLASLENGKAD